jgi:preprotein translocase subunit SecD
VDTQNQKTYGPYDSIEVFEQQCASLIVGVLCAWIADQPPEGVVFANSSSEQSESASPQMTVKGNVYIKDSGGNVILDKSDVISAATIPDPNNKNKFVIQITLNDSGRKKFAEATAKLTGQTIDVYIDNTLISSPEVICTLNSSAFDISGFTDNQQADEYTKQINLG